MLGEQITAWDKFIGFLSQPQMRTSHYNENGKNIYTSKLTIIFSILLLSLMLSFGYTTIQPLFIDETVKVEYERGFLYDSIRNKQLEAKQIGPATTWNKIGAYLYPD